MIILDTNGLHRLSGPNVVAAEQLLAHSSVDRRTIRTPERLLLDWAGEQQYIRDGGIVLGTGMPSWLAFTGQDLTIAVRLPRLTINTVWATEVVDDHPVLWPTFDRAAAPPHVPLACDWDFAVAYPDHELWLVILTTGPLLQIERMSKDSTFLVVRAPDGAFHKPPLSNIHPNGGICQGSSWRPPTSGTLAERVANVLAAFSASEWTQDLNPGLTHRAIRLRPTDGAPITLPAVHTLADKPVLSHSAYDWIPR